MDYENEDMIFLTYGLRYTPASPGVEPAVGMEVLGAFEEYSDAAVFRDIYADIDTTVEGVFVASTKLSDTVPDLEVFLQVTVDENFPGSIVVNSVGVPEGTEPFLREEEDYFEALAYPEDKEPMIDYAIEWMISTGRVNSVKDVPIVENISPQAQDLINGI